MIHEHLANVSAGEIALKLAELIFFTSANNELAGDALRALTKPPLNASSAPIASPSGFLLDAIGDQRFKVESPGCND